jgi:hypothetical protein
MADIRGLLSLFTPRLPIPKPVATGPHISAIDHMRFNQGETDELRDTEGNIVAKRSWKSSMIQGYQSAIAQSSVPVLQSVKKIVKVTTPVELVKPERRIEI